MTQDKKAIRTDRKKRKNGFYLFHVEGESEESHAVRVQQKLQRLGEAAGVEDLTIGEAITGTQAAIWQAAHDSGLVFTDFLHSMYMTDVSDSVEYYELCDEERRNGHVKYSGIENDNAKIDAASDKKVGSRIQSVYKYLLSVDPLSPVAGLVSAASFRQVVGPFSTDNGDGTFDLSVTVTVDVRMDAGDYLTLTASLGNGYETSASLSDGTQTVSLNLKNIPADQIEQMVKLSIEGMQTGFDVYLFDAEGERESSQAMVGMDSNRLPVYAEISTSIAEAHNDRILNLYKTSGDPGSSDSSDRFPLEGITFDIYYVADLKDYLSGAVKLPEEVTVQPKNQVKGFVQIHKDVVSLENDSASAEAYTDHTWIISATIPEDIANGKAYVISDSLDSRLNYTGNMQVRVESLDGQTILTTLTEGEDYILHLTKTDSSRGFTVELTHIGMNHVGGSITHIPGTTEAVVKVSFFDNEALEGEKVTTAITDENGIASIYGLSYGEYFLLESAAPAGYTPLGEAVKVIVDDSSHRVEKAVTVKNVNGTILPSTGGTGTRIYQISGFTLLLGAAFLLIAIKSKGYH